MDTVWSCAAGVNRSVAQRKGKDASAATQSATFRVLEGHFGKALHSVHFFGGVGLHEVAKLFSDVSDVYLMLQPVAAQLLASAENARKSRAIMKDRYISKEI